MQSKTHSFVKIGTTIVCGLLLLGTAVSTQAADKKGATGTWSWTMAAGRNRQGGDNAAANTNTNAARKATLKLKAEGEKLTGTLTTPAFGRGGQGGGQPRDTEISDGKIKGDDVSFNVVREANGNKMTSKYTGKLEGDSIKGKIETERNGETQSRDWEAKRDK